MQPVFPYRPESYPPRGRIWPQWGDDVLGETLSLSDGAKQSLNRKKEAMSDFHMENLQHHGLAPREEVEWPDELYSYVRGRDDPASPLNRARTQLDEAVARIKSD